MKKTFEITMTCTVEVELTEQCLTDEVFDQFNKHIYEIENKEELFSIAAKSIAMNDNSDHFIEGIGPAVWRESCSGEKLEKASVLYHMYGEEWESEEIECRED